MSEQHTCFPHCGPGRGRSPELVGREALIHPIVHIRRTADCYFPRAGLDKGDVMPRQVDRLVSLLPCVAFQIKKTVSHSGLTHNKFKIMSYGFSNANSSE